MVNSFRGCLPKALALLLFLGGVTLWNPTGEARGFGFGHHGSDLEALFFHKAIFFLKCADQIGLTDDQMEKIKTLKLEVKKGLIRQNAELEILEMDVETALRGRPVDVKAVNLILDKKFEIKKAKARSLVQAIADLKAILTDEQYGKAKALWRGK
jgi:hypothetical protein